MKTCAACGIAKPLTEFHRRPDRPGGAVPRCKPCKSQRAKDYRAANLEAVRARSRDWHHSNRDRSIANTVRWQTENIERHRARSAQWRADNRERLSESFRRWASENAPQVLAIKARRRAAELRAVVAWSDPDQIMPFYEAARALTQAGAPHAVDHIVPLQSKSVCGLHVHQNMQVLPKAANSSKGNRWWPDMWEE